MPRPRKDQEGPSAVERMEEAFWEALAEQPYRTMTVGDIARRAHVNKNAFYYHHRDLFALAEQAIDNTLPRELAGMILTGNGIEGVDGRALASIDDDMRRRTNRIRLVAGPHGSRELTALLKDRILQAWFDIFGIRGSDLDRESTIAVTFALGGLVELLGDERIFPEGASVPEALFGSSLMRTMSTSVIETLRNAAARAGGGAR